VPVAVMLSRFPRVRTKLNKFSGLRLRSRLQRFPEARWCVNSQSHRKPSTI
jgi:hypothetical protein